MTEDIAAIFSDELRPLYSGGTVLLSSVDEDALPGLGFERKSFPPARNCVIWVHEIPDTFRFTNYLAIVIDDRRVELCGIADHLLSRQGWKAYSFGVFCYRVHFRRPDGEYDNTEAVRYIDAKIREMIEKGAVRICEVVP